MEFYTIHYKKDVIAEMPCQLCLNGINKVEKYPISINSILRDKLYNRMGKHILKKKKVFLRRPAILTIDKPPASQIPNYII